MVSGCGAPQASPGATQPAADVLSALTEDESIAALLPEATLEREKQVCPTNGKPAYEVLGLRHPRSEISPPEHT